MIVLRSLDNLGEIKNSVVTIGTYDGIHLGHQQIFSEVIDRAKKRNAKSVFVTFEPHPKEVVKKTQVHLLTTLNERIEQFRNWLPDIVFIVNFTYEFSRLSPKEFYQQFVVNKFHASEIVEGSDHMFGRDREAGIRELITMGKEFHFEVLVVPKVSVDGEEVSSSKIRTEIQDGNIEKAKSFLGRNYSLTGEVIRGDGRGKQLGFPTANIKPLSSNKLIPALGVYVVNVSVGGKTYNGMLNIGTRPTFYENGECSIEVNLFDVEKDFYGQEMTIHFLKRIRNDEKFSSVEDLVSQIHNDKRQSLQYLQTIN